MEIETHVRNIYKGYEEPLNMINYFFRDSPIIKLLVNGAIMLVSGIFLISVLFALHKHGSHPLIGIRLYILTLVVLLVIDIIATGKDLRDIRAKRKKLTIYSAIPLSLLVLTIFILAHQLYRWKVLNKRSAHFSIFFSGFKVIILFGITLHSAMIVFKTLETLSKDNKSISFP